ncbi:MAG: sulfatase-like hydrolase/transferase [Chloroflexi bacterium]|nr:sulfatase-like hydrolase/transferase [Chloroflexota bacterium]
MLSKPNIILLTIDTLRADRLGCYGYERPLTPNLDRLAESGICFTQAVTGGSWTQAAFPVMMTSSYASMYGGCLGALAEERPSPISVMVANGYTTGGFSTSPLLSRTYGYDRHFHHFVDLKPDETDPFLRQVKGGQKLLRLPVTHVLSNLLGQQTRPAQIYVTAEKLTDAAWAWISQVKDKPFFAWLHYMDVHWPYHREETLTKPDDIAQMWRDLSHLHRVTFGQDTVSPQQREHYIQLYEEALRYTDDQVGRLLDYLEDVGLMENTIIVAVSDHGEEFLEHGRWGHFENNLCDEILHVPLIIRLPGQDKAAIIEDQVRLLDLMPTLLDLCGCDPLDGLEGASLRPLWTGDGATHDAAVSVSEMWREEWHIIAVRTKKLKYIWDSKRPDQPLLFDLQADPGEKNNMCRQHPEMAQEFQAYVETRLQRMLETQPSQKSVEPELDEEMLARLRGLGYVE